MTLTHAYNHYTTDILIVNKEVLSTMQIKTFKHIINSTTRWSLKVKCRVLCLYWKSAVLENVLCNLDLAHDVENIIGVMCTC